METPHGRRTRPPQPGRSHATEETPVGPGGPHPRRGQAATRRAQGPHGVDRNARTRASARSCARADSGHQHSASSACPCTGTACIPDRQHERWDPPSATWVRPSSRDRTSPRGHAVPAAWVPDAASSRVRLSPVTNRKSVDTDPIRPAAPSLSLPPGIPPPPGMPLPPG